MHFKRLERNGSRDYYLFVANVTSSELKLLYEKKSVIHSSFHLLGISHEIKKSDRLKSALVRPLRL